MADLKGKTVFITGASRGIGRAIGLRAARDGANVVVLGKTVDPHPTLPGTILDAAAEMEAAGGRAIAVAADVRSEEDVAAAVAKAVEAFGGIDCLVNNASAIFLAGLADTPVKKFDLMHQVTARAAFVCCRACQPHLAASSNPHILSLCPPLNLDPRWVGAHVAYTMAKYGMSLLTLGLAEELKAQGIAVNALWPRTLIATSAVRMLGGDDVSLHSRKPEVVADAAHAILVRDSRLCTGNFFLDESVLREEGVTDFSGYAIDPTVEPYPDFFL
jgi:citronellol/citronellal dehydrogenase